MAAGRGAAESSAPPPPPPPRQAPLTIAWRNTKFGHQNVWQDTVRFINDPLHCNVYVVYGYFIVITIFRRSYALNLNPLPK